MIYKCPGSQNFSQPKPENIKCPFCSAEVEIWTDEVKATCPKCDREIIREAEQSCLDWCKYAKECVGEELYGRYMRNKSVTIKQKLMRELEEYFGEDKRRIAHAKKVTDYAEEILKEEGGDWHIVIPASILHDVGIKVAEKKHGSSDEKYQEEEGPVIARNILLKYGLKKEYIDEICCIIANHHSPGRIDTLNFRILYDADCLVNLKDTADAKDSKKINSAIDKTFLTETGRKTAKRVYLDAE